MMEDFSSFKDLSCDFDFTEAFDRVSHVKSLKKLFDIGIQGKLICSTGLKMF